MSSTSEFEGQMKIEPWLVLEKHFLLIDHPSLYLPDEWIVMMSGGVDIVSDIISDDKNNDILSNNDTTSLLLDCTQLFDSNYDPTFVIASICVFIFGILFCMFGKKVLCHICVL